MKANYIPSLNGLRAICILMVIGDHLMFFKIIPRTTVTKILGLILFNGGLGVSIFFVISGFLITKLLINESKNSGSISLRSFYMRRVLRIFPAYYLLLTVYYMMQSYGLIHLNRGTWISSLTYTNQFYKNIPEATFHLWSLSTEEIFYLAWPLLFIAFFSKVRLRYLYATILFFSLFRFCSTYFHEVYFNNTILSTGDSLLIGCLSAIHYKSISAWVIRNSRLCVLAFPLLAFLVFLDVYAFKLSTIQGFSSSEKEVVRFVSSILSALCGFRGTLTCSLIVIIVFYSIHVKNQWYHFLNLKAMNYVGVLSYSIYLWQQIIISSSAHYHISIPVILLLIAIFANLSYYLVEKPFLMLKEKLQINNLLISH